MKKKESKKKYPFLLKSCGVIFLIFLAVSIISSVYTRREYLEIHIDEVEKNTEMLNHYAAERLTSYRSLPVLIDAWERDLDVYSSAFMAQLQSSAWVNQLDLPEVTAERVAAMKNSDQRAFGYVCYTRIAYGFDLMYNSFRPTALYCVKMVGGSPAYLFWSDNNSENNYMIPTVPHEIGWDDRPALNEIYASASPDCVMIKGESSVTGEDQMLVYTPIVENGTVLCVIVCAKDWVEVENDISYSAFKIAVVNVLLLFLLTLIVVAFVYRYEREKLRIAAEQQKTQAEMAIAAKIQSDQMPDPAREFSAQKGIDISGFIKPARDIGGDFFDCFMIDDSHTAIVIADVSDKGIPAALFMMLTKTLIKSELMQGSSPAEALNRINRQVSEQNAQGMFVTIWLAVVNLLTGACSIVNAGHENPFVKPAGGAWNELRYHHALAVGITPKTVYTDHKYTLNPGDSIFVYTDGVTDAVNSQHRRYGCERLKAALNGCADSGAESLVRLVREDVSAFFAGEEQFDDITMLCVRFLGFSSITVAAQNGSMNAVNAFVLSKAETFGASKQALKEIRLSVEEIFGNIVDYAYGEGSGTVAVEVMPDERTKVFSVVFRDSGAPFDPTARESPDLTQQNVGGLGIYLAKKMMDELEYEYKDGHNVLTMRKKLCSDASFKEETKCLTQE
ncbi:MAG: SpoIIE family protein phosphatase [Clostridia bacterium]|nr:SpoIIE family protein phosphatase [Clostridia bacterium]